MIVLLLASGCTALVRIEKNVPGATVKIDGRVVGKTPLELNLSDGIWEDFSVVIEKPGYSILRTRLHKEPKVGTFIAGMFLCWPLLLWTYGPEPYQNFELVGELYPAVSAGSYPKKKTCFKI
jgi:hypothetical protein